MIQLPNGCYCSDLKVNPANWQHARASVKKDWYIYFRFYDPTFKNSDKYKKGKLVIVKGMNEFKRLAERQEMCRQIMRFELDRMKADGYNHITGQANTPIEIEGDIDPGTPVLNALDMALARLTVEPHTREDMESVLKYFGEAAGQLRLDMLPVSEMRRKHVKLILAQTGKNKKGWSATNFNKYRGYLMSLFKELVSCEAIDSNPVTDIERMKMVKKIREVLTDKQRTDKLPLLKKQFPEFYRFIQIFFHSGARRTELMRLQVKDVDLVRQVFKVTVKKGRQSREVEKPIKDVALPYWTELLAAEPKPDFYVFSVGLMPGPKAIRPEQVTRRWEEHVKVKLNITADLYSLKHLNTTEVVDALDEQAAATLNSHTSTAMVVSIYDVKNKKRNIEKIKKVSNSL